jgi:hypothetical protein
VLLAGELALRAFPQLMPRQWKIRYFGAKAGLTFKVVPDTELGFLHSPDRHTDHLGFGNAEPWPERPAMVFLGDSILGANIGSEQSFPVAFLACCPTSRSSILAWPGPAWSGST